jgi:hypothetical protein
MYCRAVQLLVIAIFGNEPRSINIPRGPIILKVVCSTPTTLEVKVCTPHPQGKTYVIFSVCHLSVCLLDIAEMLRKSGLRRLDGADIEFGCKADFDP